MISLDIVPFVYYETQISIIILLRINYHSKANWCRTVNELSRS